MSSFRPPADPAMTKPESDSLNAKTATEGMASHRREVVSLEEDPLNGNSDYIMKETDLLFGPTPPFESGEGLSYTPPIVSSVPPPESGDGLSFTPVGEPMDEGKEGNLLVNPVAPNESGEGLPFAPQDWPNPGDTWSWKVGRRVASTGYYMDRYLYPPKHFEKGRLSFGSKVSVEHFIRSEFPDANVDAFFASFTWRVPSTQPPTSDVKKETEDDENEPKSHETSAQKKRKKKGGPAVSAKRQTRRSLKGTPSEGSEISEFTGEQEFFPQLTPEEFDDYLNSLDNIINQPLEENNLSSAKAIKYVHSEEEMAELRSKLNALMAMEFSALVSSEHVAELKDLASKLRKDPDLSVEQLIKLKLIEEIPLISDVYLESKELQEQAQSFFADLDSNKAEVGSLKTQYVELKEETFEIQADLDSSALIIQDIEEQIARLQARRDELASHVESKNERKDELTSDKKVVANTVHSVVRKIQLANSRVQEWEVKKKYAVEREAEILDRFAPLQGFSI